MAKGIKIYHIRIERRGTFGNTYPAREVSGTLPELIQRFSYDLEVGSSWQHEKGNKRINRNPNTIGALLKNLYNAKNNAASNGYSGYSYILDRIEEAKPCVTTTE
jgi:hypothetical protein